MSTSPSFCHYGVEFELGTEVFWYGATVTIKEIRITNSDTPAGFKVEYILFCPKYGILYTDGISEKELLNCRHNNLKEYPLNALTAF